LHIHLGDRIVLEIFIVVIIEIVIVIERNSFRPEHFRQERELVWLESLDKSLFFVPFFVLNGGQVRETGRHTLEDTSGGT
jgi:hypothetical protein